MQKVWWWVLEHGDQRWPVPFIFAHYCVCLREASCSLTSCLRVQGNLLPQPQLCLPHTARWEQALVAESAAPSNTLQTACKHQCHTNLIWPIRMAGSSPIWNFHYWKPDEVGPWYRSSIAKMNMNTCAQTCTCAYQNYGIVCSFPCSRKKRRAL